MQPLVRLGATAAALILPIFALAACRPAAEPPTGAARVTAFVDATVLTMAADGAGSSGSSVLPGHTVLVRGDRIVALGPTEEVAVPAGAHRIDGRGRFLMPGLIDAHVHLEYFDDPAVLALFLAHGVTTVRSMDGRPRILEWRDAIAQGELEGPTIVTAGPLLDGDPPLRDDHAVVADSAEAAAAVREQAAAAYDFVKVYTNLSPDAYRGVLAAARAAGLPVAGHVPRDVPVGDALAGGQASIEHLVDYGDLIEAAGSPFRDGWHWSKLYLAMPADPAEIDRAAEQIAASGVWSVPTLVQADRALAPADSVERWLRDPLLSLLPPEAPAVWSEQVLDAAERLDAEDRAIVERGRDNRLRLLGALHRAGARLMVGTDTPNPFVIPGASVHLEIETFVSAGATPLEALAYATREPGLFLGGQPAAGTVELGARADLLLLPEDPRTDLAHLRSPVGVMVRGRWLPAERLEERLESLRRQP